MEDEYNTTITVKKTKKILMEINKSSNLDNRIK